MIPYKREPLACLSNVKFRTNGCPGNKTASSIFGKQNSSLIHTLIRTGLVFSFTKCNLLSNNAAPDKTIERNGLASEGAGGWRREIERQLVKSVLVNLPERSKSCIMHPY